MLNKELLLISSGGGGGNSIGKPVIEAWGRSITLGYVTDYYFQVKCNPPYPAEYFNFEAQKRGDEAGYPDTGNRSITKLDGSSAVYQCSSPSCAGYERVRICWADQDGNQLSDWSDWVTVQIF